MKVVLSTVGKFHMFALAYELERRQILQQIFTGFPWFAVKNERVSRQLVSTFPYIRPFLMSLRHLPFRAPFFLKEALHVTSSVAMDLYVRENIPPCDIFVGHDTVGLLSGLRAQERGVPYVCDTGSSHIGWRHKILDSECEQLGISKLPTPWTLARECRGYDVADLIVVPSSFAKRTFLENAIDARKIAVVPYGVDLNKFYRTGRPKDGKFEILFVGHFGVRKGARYLLDAFKRLNHKNVRLTIVGTISNDIETLYRTLLRADRVSIRGHVPHHELKNIMSQSHVLVLPSLDDGFGLVLAEAMACGCPIIATENTGGPDLITEGAEGFIVPPKDVESLVQKIETLIVAPRIQVEMGENAIKKAAELGGWSNYGEKMIAVYKQLIEIHTDTKKCIHDF